MTSREYIEELKILPIDWSVLHYDASVILKALKAWRQSFVLYRSSDADRKIPDLEEDRMVFVWSKTVIDLGTWQQQMAGVDEPGLFQALVQARVIFPDGTARPDYFFRPKLKGE